MSICSCAGCHSITTVFLLNGILLKIILVNVILLYYATRKSACVILLNFTLFIAILLSVILTEVMAPTA